MPKPKLSRRLRSYLFLSLNTLCWGAILIVAKPALEITNSFRFLFYRYLIAAIICLPLLAHYWHYLKRHRRIIGTVMAIETLGTVIALSLLYFGLGQTTAIEASLLATTTPIFATLIGMWLLKERQETHESLGMILAVIGTIGLTLIPVWLNGQNGHHVSLIGNLLILGHNLITGFYLVLTKKYYQRSPKLLISIIGFYFALVAFFLINWLQMSYLDGGLQLATGLRQFLTTIVAELSQWQVLGPTLYVATLGSVIGYTAYLKGQEGVEASEASWFWYLEPVVYLPLGVLLLQERVTWWQLASLAIVLFGVMVAEKRFRKKRR